MTKHAPPVRDAFDDAHIGNAGAQTRYDSYKRETEYLDLNETLARDPDVAALSALTGRDAVTCYLWMAAGGICYLCGGMTVLTLPAVGGITAATATIDHIQARSRGGGHSLGNLGLVHNECNIRKGDKLLEEVLPWTGRVVAGLAFLIIGPSMVIGVWPDYAGIVLEPDEPAMA